MAGCAAREPLLVNGREEAPVEPGRRVRIRLYDAGHAASRFGSGYLVGPRLALTAAHVLGTDGSGPVPGRVTVCRPDAGTGQYTGRVRWYRRRDHVDAALVEVDEGQGRPPPASLADITRRPPQRWGRLIGTRRTRSPWWASRTCGRIR
ncbi:MULTISPECIES: trypsin-like peptidase domain-containing protein [Streptomyces]|uniref:trypsin-like peptidase domain-containing protein n=1 Tax=Streptomyces TaxID=1883 RepID=UPI00163D38C9|nr:MULTISPECIES: trypsin-like peptidase domain-containing protein [Streptomyces]MBC2876174.1 trypsin-like peptidase domain-containing protein [Streptomyces sp. TYQ1024]UBI35596.1 serine protease [Streptomyces mobaraensis]UKW28191.1 serine protease [Streptomyces sp. TYQ1024]